LFKTVSPSVRAWSWVRSKARTVPIRVPAWSPRVVSCASCSPEGAARRERRKYSEKFQILKVTGWISGGFGEALFEPDNSNS
jgi:hypothetical protein